MTKININSTTPTQLDWLVAKCLYPKSVIYLKLNATFKSRKQEGIFLPDFNQSTNWAHGGPIIEREGIDIQQVFCGMEGSFSEPCGWQAMRYTRSGVLNPPRQVANTSLIAAMRCYVTLKMGDVVEIPEELL